jgi:hypothetical protein
VPDEVNLAHAQALGLTAAPVDAVEEAVGAVEAVLEDAECLQFARASAGEGEGADVGGDDPCPGGIASPDGG